VFRVCVEGGHTVLVEGPSEVEVLDGSFDVFGIEAEAGFTTAVDVFKAAPFYAKDGGELAVKGGKVSCVAGRSIPSSWDEAVNEILSGASKVMVIGGVDVGKSGFITYAVNRLLAEGRRVAIVDADTGQSDIGPPTTIGLGIIKRPVVMLSEIPLYDAVFLGLTSPSGLLHRSVAAVSYLANLALSKLGVDTVMVNTTGWVTDPEGRDLKLAKALALQPDLVVAIQSSGELEHLAKFMERLYRLLRIDSAIALRPRTREERRVIRSSLYARYFEGASDKVVDPQSLAVSYSFIWTGSRIGPEEIEKIQSVVGADVVWAEMSFDCVVAVTSGPPKRDSAERLKEMYEVRNARVFEVNALNHILVSFGDEEKMFLGLGIIRCFDPETGALIVYTNVDVAKASFMQVGYIRLNPETFEEEGWVERWGM